MKKIALITAVTLCSSLVYAQNGFYFGGDIAAGVLSQSVPDENNPLERVLYEQYQVKAGYSFHNWQLETGIGYLTTRVKWTGYEQFTGAILNAGTGFLYEPPKIKYETINHNFILPLCLSYKINMGKRLSLSPGIGGEFIYNTSTEIKNPDTNPWASGNRYYHNNTVSEALLINLEVAYKLNSRWSIIAGPSMQCMPLPAMFNSGYDYAYLFNAGVKYYLQKKKAK